MGGQWLIKKTSIKTQGVSKYFPGVQALKDLTFRDPRRGPCPWGERRWEVHSDEDHCPRVYRGWGIFIEGQSIEIWDTRWQSWAELDPSRLNRSHADGRTKYLYGKNLPPDLAPLTETMRLKAGFLAEVTSRHEDRGES
jgi:hypothetical protein